MALLGWTDYWKRCEAGQYLFESAVEGPYLLSTEARQAAQFVQGEHLLMFADGGTVGPRRQWRGTALVGVVCIGQVANDAAAAVAAGVARRHGIADTLTSAYVNTIGDWSRDTLPWFDSWVICWLSCH